MRQKAGVVLGVSSALPGVTHACTHTVPPPRNRGAWDVPLHQVGAELHWYRHGCWKRMLWLQTTCLQVEVIDLLTTARHACWPVENSKHPEPVALSAMHACTLHLPRAAQGHMAQLVPHAHTVQGISMTGGGARCGCGRRHASRPSARCAR